MFTVRVLILGLLLCSTTASYMRGCYFTNWAQYRSGTAKFSVSNYVPGLCTHIFYAFAGINEADNTIKSIEWNDEGATGQYKQINALKTTDPTLEKTILSVGGGSFGTALFKQMASNGREAFINSAISFLRTWGFDGLDIDWEFPIGPTDRQNLVLLLKETKEAMQLEAETTGNTQLILTSAVSSSFWYLNQGGFDIPGMAQYLDYALIMTYDFHGSWELQTGLQSPLFSQDNGNTAFACEYWYSNGMPKHKIIVGLPTYGRGWTLSDAQQTNVGDAASGTSAALPFTAEAGFAAYFEIGELLNSNAQYFWHDESKESYVVVGDQWFGYDDEDTFNAKLSWIDQNSYGGAFVWALDLDDFNGLYAANKFPLTRLMQVNLEGESTPPPPPPPASVCSNALWGECGGSGWTGSICCPEGSVCNYKDEWYSQCVLGAGFSPPPPSPPPPPPPPPPKSGTNGVTTRYWDCCKVSCGWDDKAAYLNSQPVQNCAIDGVTPADKNEESSCYEEDPGQSYTCNDNQPWAASDNLSYGFAATSIANQDEAETCCACYALTFTSGPVVGKVHVVQSTDIGTLETDHFDLMMPGGGVGVFHRGCITQWGVDGWGPAYGGISLRSECENLPVQIRPGCYWRFDWFMNADNPDMQFTRVKCPTQLTDVSKCIRTDDHNYPPAPQP